MSSSVPTKIAPSQRPLRQNLDGARSHSLPSPTRRINDPHNPQSPGNRVASRPEHNERQEKAESTKKHMENRPTGTQSSRFPAQDSYDRGWSDIDSNLSEWPLEAFKQLLGYVRELAAHVDRFEKAEAWSHSMFKDLFERLHRLEISQQIGLSNCSNSVSDVDERLHAELANIVSLVRYQAGQHAYILSVADTLRRDILLSQACGSEQSAANVQEKQESKTRVDEFASTIETGKSTAESELPLAQVQAFVDQHMQKGYYKFMVEHWADLRGEVNEIVRESIVEQEHANTKRIEELKAHLQEEMSDHVNMNMSEARKANEGTFVDKFSESTAVFIRRFAQHDAQIAEVEKKIAGSRAIHDKDQEQLRNTLRGLSDTCAELRNRLVLQSEELAAFKKSLGKTGQLVAIEQSLDKTDAEVSNIDEDCLSTRTALGPESPGCEDFITHWVVSALHDEIHSTEGFITSRELFSMSRKWIPDTVSQPNDTCLKLPYVQEVISTVTETIAKFTNGSGKDNKDKRSMFESLSSRLNFEMMLAHWWLDKQNLPLIRSDFDRGLRAWMRKLKLARGEAGVGSAEKNENDVCQPNEKQLDSRTKNNNYNVSNNKRCFPKAPEILPQQEVYYSLSELLNSRF